MPTQGDVIGFFKTSELLFIGYLAVVSVCLINPRKALQAKINFANRMLIRHGFKGQVELTDAAVSRFRRDKWILFVLLLIAIYLIQLI